MTYQLQEPCKPGCPDGLHYHLEDVTAENEWAANVPLRHGFTGGRVEPKPGETVTSEESVRRTYELLADGPQRLVPVG